MSSSGALGEVALESSPRELNPLENASDSPHDAHDAHRHPHPSWPLRSIHTEAELISTLTEKKDTDHIEKPDRQNLQRTTSHSFPLNPTHFSEAVQRYAQTLRRRLHKKYLFHLVYSFFPFFRWIQIYWANPRTRKMSVIADFIAGATIGIVSIPQGLAYGLLTGLPPIYGLYAAILPAFFYCLCGQSRHLSLGPFSVISLMVANAIHGAGLDSSPSDAINAALALSILVGVILMTLSAFHLGYLVSFLSNPALSAFTCASAFLTASSQLGAWTGISIPTSDTFIDPVIYFFQNISHVNIASFLLGLVSMCILLLIEKINRRFKWRCPIPSQLIVVILGIIIVTTTGIDQSWDIEVIGSIPPGLPPPTFPKFWNINLIQSSVLIAIVAFIMSISIEKRFSLVNGYEIDPNHELWSLGLSNLLGGFFNAYPTSGSLSRSALLDDLHPTSMLHNLVSSCIILVTVLSLTSIFHSLPKCVLAAIIFVALKSLFMQITEAKRLYGISKIDFAVWMATFLSTLSFSTSTGVIVGISLSIVPLLHQTAKPRYEILGRLPGTTLYRNARLYRQAKLQPGVLIFRFLSPIHFANKDYLKKKLRKAVRWMERGGKDKVKGEIEDAAGRKDEFKAELDIMGIEGIRRQMTTPAATVTVEDEKKEDAAFPQAPSNSSPPPAVTVPNPLPASRISFPVHTIILDCSQVTNADDSSLGILENLLSLLVIRRVLFACAVSGSFRDFLLRTNLAKKVGNCEIIFLTVYDAMEYLRQESSKMKIAEAKAGSIRIQDGMDETDRYSKVMKVSMDRELSRSCLRIHEETNDVTSRMSSESVIEHREQYSALCRGIVDEEKKTVSIQRVDEKNI